MPRGYGVLQRPHLPQMGNGRAESSAFRRRDLPGAPVEGHSGASVVCHDSGVAFRDDDLVSQLDHARGSRRVLLAAALGDSEGASGPARLRLLLRETRPGTSDLRCAVLLALAKRCKEEAHEDYVAALDSTDAGTREYAVLALSAYGRDGVWDAMADRLIKRLKRRNRRGSTPSTTLLMITYLIRHATSPERVTALIEILRRHWAGLDPGTVADDDALDWRGLRQNAAWVQDYWPEAAPGGPPPDQVAVPNISAIELWVRKEPIFTSSITTLHR